MGIYTMSMRYNRTINLLSYLGLVYAGGSRPPESLLQVCGHRPLGLGALNAAADHPGDSFEAKLNDWAKQEFWE